MQMLDGKQDDAPRQKDQGVKGGTNQSAPTSPAGFDSFQDDDLPF